MGNALKRAVQSASKRAAATQPAQDKLPSDINSRLYGFRRGEASQQVPQGGDGNVSQDLIDFMNDAGPASKTQADPSTVGQRRSRPAREQNAMASPPTAEELKKIYEKADAVVDELKKSAGPPLGALSDVSPENMPPEGMEDAFVSPTRPSSHVILQDESDGKIRLTVAQINAILSGTAAIPSGENVSDTELRNIQEMTRKVLRVPQVVEENGEKIGR